MKLITTHKFDKKTSSNPSVTLFIDPTAAIFTLKLRMIL
jgi:hypothetical protein